jgi:DsbC/DsbD-like thiol-disulfide interchange protein
MSVRWSFMLRRISRQCVLTAAAGVLLAIAPHFKAAAADSSPWDGDARSAVRLVSGSHAGRDGVVRAGVEIRLGAGWKTYWRYPGDSGVPPIFDFSKSENAKSVTILWPAPHRFEYEGGGASIGYKGDVMFPVHVVAENSKRPVTLRLAIDYAVCEKLCIPARGKAVLELASASSANGPASGPSLNDSRLAAAEANAPKPARVGEATPLGIAAVRREPGQPHPRIVVEVTAPAGAALDLFAEGPTPEWALPVPEPISGAPAGRRWFAFDLDGAPPGVDPTGAALHFTLVSGDNAVEVTAVPK